MYLRREKTKNKMLNIEDMKIKITLLLIVFYVISFSQVSNTGVMDTTDGEHIGKISVGGYVDAYYGYNFNQPNANSTPYFVSMNRHNEMNINLAFIDLRYNTERVRARIVPGFGTYINSNYAAEPGALKNIVEASAGLRLSKRKNVWLDYGIIGSPYTNESAISKDHLVYTRSFSAENVPYYLSGAKLSVTLSQKINLYLYLINGWQQIIDQNQYKSFGSQLEIRPNNKNLINWNTYIGDERSAAHPLYRNRYFTDLYWIFESGKKFSSTACAYIGLQQKIGQESIWWSANYSARYSFTHKFSLSGRVEYFTDPNNTMISSIISSNQFSSYSGTVGVNYKIGDHALLRLENRIFYSEKDNYFDQNFNAVKMMNVAMSNITVWF